MSTMVCDMMIQHEIEREKLGEFQFLVGGKLNGDVVAWVEVFVRL